MATYRLRVVEVTDDGCYRRIVGVDEDFATVYDSTATGATPATGGPGGVTGIGSTVLEVLQIPLLEEADDSPGVYVAAGSYQASWPGCVLYRSSDDGVSFAEVGIVSLRATLGHVLVPPRVWAGGSTMDPASMTVQLGGGYGALASTTWPGLLGGANEAVIGDEVIQFLRADLVSAGVYKLSGLLRGRRGTEVATLAPGSRFVLLDEAVKRYDSQLTLRGRETIYRGVSYGNLSTDGMDVAVTEQQQHLVPLEPLSLYVAPAGANGYVTRWRRRSRYPSEWTAEEVPIAESSERYRIRVYGSSASDLVNTIVTSPTHTFGAGADLTYYFVEVSQLSDRVGAGPAATYQIGA